MWLDRASRDHPYDQRKTVNVTVEPRVTLLDAMRNYLDLTGAKRVCDRGTCGACTVILAARPCTVAASWPSTRRAKASRHRRSRGGNNLHPVSAAFVNNDAQQCGYCTAGFVMAAKGFIDKHPNPTMDDVKHGLGGNLCRCGTYMGFAKPCSKPPNK